MSYVIHVILLYVKELLVLVVFLWIILEELRIFSVALSFAEILNYRERHSGRTLSAQLNLLRC